MLGAQQDKPQIRLLGKANLAQEGAGEVAGEEQKTPPRHEDPP